MIQEEMKAMSQGILKSPSQPRKNPFAKKQKKLLSKAIKSNRNQCIYKFVAGVGGGKQAIVMKA